MASSNHRQSNHVWHQRNGRSASDRESRKTAAASLYRHRSYAEQHHGRRPPIQAACRQSRRHSAARRQPFRASTCAALRAPVQPPPAKEAKPKSEWFETGPSAHSKLFGKGRAKLLLNCWTLFGSAGALPSRMRSGGKMERDCKATGQIVTRWFRQKTSVASTASNLMDRYDSLPRPSMRITGEGRGRPS